MVGLADGERPVGARSACSRSLGHAHRDVVEPRAAGLARDVHLRAGRRAGEVDLVRAPFDRPAQGGRVGVAVGAEEDPRGEAGGVLAAEEPERVPGVSLHERPRKRRCDGSRSRLGRGSRRDVGSRRGRGSRLGRGSRRDVGSRRGRSSRLGRSSHRDVGTRRSLDRGRRLLRGPGAASRRNRDVREAMARTRERSVIAPRGRAGEDAIRPRLLAHGRRGERPHGVHRARWIAVQNFVSTGVPLRWISPRKLTSMS